MFPKVDDNCSEPNDVHYLDDHVHHASDCNADVDVDVDVVEDDPMRRNSFAVEDH